MSQESDMLDDTHREILPGVALRFLFLRLIA